MFVWLICLNMQDSFTLSHQVLYCFFFFSQNRWLSDNPKQREDFCGSEIVQDVSATLSWLKASGCLKTELQPCSGKWLYIWSELAPRTRVLYLRVHACTQVCVCVSMSMYAGILWVLRPKQMGYLTLIFLTTVWAAMPVLASGDDFMLVRKFENCLQRSFRVFWFPHMQA